MTALPKAPVLLVDYLVELSRRANRRNPGFPLRHYGPSEISLGRLSESSDDLPELEEELDLDNEYQITRPDWRHMWTLRRGSRYRGLCRLLAPIAWGGKK